MLKFRQWLELMEPNMFTAKDPANGPHVTGDDQDDDELDNEDLPVQLPMGMRSHKATNAFPELRYKGCKRMKKR